MSLRGHDQHTILSLRLLIARAGSRERLAWWDDESLTSSGGFLLGRLFPVAPALAGRSLALRAASGRHDAACPAPQLHLYRLDAKNRDRLALRYAPLLPIPYPEEPILTVETLREHLEPLIGDSPQPDIVRRDASGRIELDILPPAIDESTLLHRACSLAWAYLEGKPGQPVFPCFVEKQVAWKR